MDLFRVRLNCIDHYQATPSRYDPQLRNDIRPSQISKGPRVPVVRVFGSTETGQKVCAHIHGAFPYLYVEYEGGLSPDEVGAYIYRFHLSIDHALAVSYRRDQKGDSARFVARITLVKGVPFYGFHVGYRFFLKIYMFNPIVMTRLADLLQQGVIMKNKFQPYEAHLQYLLQFMTDFNLYGCDYLDASVTRFRSPVPEYEQGSSSLHKWHSRSISVDHITDETTLPRSSHCSIEVDICVQDIINRHKVKERPLHHGFTERTNPLPGDMKLVYSMAGLWKDETKRRKQKMQDPTEGSSPFPPEVLVSMSANARDSQPQGWLHEEEFRTEIQNLISEEKLSVDPEELTFETFAKPHPYEEHVNTTLESVEDLFPSKLAPALGLPFGMEAEQDLRSSIVVDEGKVRQVGEAHNDFYPEDSDEDAIAALVAIEKAAAKVSCGPTDQLPQEDLELAAALNINPDKFDKKTFWRSALGVCQSGLVTGELPDLPVNQELLDYAEDEGFIGRTEKAPTLTSSNLTQLKRPLDDLLSSQASNKRTRLNQLSMVDEDEMDLVPVPSTDANKNLASSFRGASILKGPPSLNKNTGSVLKGASGSNQKLNFPTVKDQNDPNTKLRLSQMSQKSASQQTDDGRHTKHVSFDPSGFLPAEAELPQMALSSSMKSSGGREEDESHESKIQRAMSRFASQQVYLVSSLPPSAAAVASSLKQYGLPDVIYQDAYYSREKDVPGRMREYAGKEFRLESNTLPFLPEFDPTGTAPANYGLKYETFDKTTAELRYKRQRKKCSLRSWELTNPPPTYQEVEEWWAEKERRANATEGFKISSTPRQYQSQIDGPTPKNKHGFKYTPGKKSTSVQHEIQYMSTMSLEVHVNTRGKFVPNPEEDEVQCVFWAIKSDGTASGSQDSAGVQTGILLLSNDAEFTQRIQRQTNAEVIEENSELDLMVRMVEIVRNHDPDILTGYEVHGSSWGYLIERARLKYDYNLCDEFSRMKTESHGRFGKENDRWGFNTTSTIRVTGRHMVNVWRAMRGELNLLQYTMENVVWHLLHRRIPHYSWQSLTNWYKGGKHRELNRMLRYYQNRTKIDLEILDANELVSRTSEQARLLGVDFFSVFSRGSQFKVESIMFRIAKPENFLLVSPNRKQVGGQNALECLPLVMEPQSAFYNSPLLVLDFQSLYPSVMIAYNYCYSTFLGRVTDWRGMNKMGFTEYKRQKGLLALLEDYINIAPNGMMYAKTEIRKSLLAKMLTEILETRVMVKSGMKQDKDDKTLQQLLNNRQLALKLLANVTYGYTSASFSGRMPCSEIADSIVQTGRETLERAIAYIHSVEKWGAEVVYGDTDSLFIYLKGRTKDEAFDIGNEISKAITEMNPRPIKLKFEKVYHPCVLLAKKRYVGYKYESKDQVKPEFDAKGIETVRRDGTPAEQKIEEKALRLLFETADLSQVKDYFQKQCQKIMRNNVSVQDFCFAKEVRLGTYSDKGAPPAGALISTKRMLQDARAEPQYGERVPYVVITGAPGARLIDRCVAPEELLSNPHWQLDAEYYISKNLIPPLERIFNLVGANVRQWYDEMPKVQRIYHATTLGKKKTTLESYMKSTNCLVCGLKFSQEDNALCPSCRKNAPSSLLTLQTRLTTEERRLQEVLSLCRSCSGLGPIEDVQCDSKDCPVFWTRMRQASKTKGQRNASQPVIQSLVDSVEKLSLEW
ncbi:DNA polymerase zeta subunit [Fusarium oxysporum f. sp. raphani 54005]|uniref:DNA polymerase n=3 Tax=Fusarium oxysporum TaxID=5507 RepID=X0CVE8_FUSOX|nr:DNA polymerase zeta subunit [Fusarium oxysporum f. sp. pisi HDV247]EXK98131.1 DNA polymerase zeta subunit [Fusarium oxysporum f. sp. raphani 54005]KAJ4034764.1 DNA polymerase zeta [Fusarium oxysporum]KAJ4079196.1 DNA polymerase zeta [Fusarium oxysporum]